MSDIKDESVVMMEQEHLKEEEKNEKKPVKRRSVTEDEDKAKNDESMTKVDEFDGRRRTRSAARGLQAPVPAPTPPKKERLSKSSPKTKGGTRGRPKRQAANDEKEETPETTTKVEVHPEPMETDACKASLTVGKCDAGSAATTAKEIETNDVKPDSSKENNAEEKIKPDLTDKDDKKAPADEKSTANKKESSGNKDCPDNKGSGEKIASGENAISADNKADNKVISNEKIVSGEKAASGDAESVTENKPGIADKLNDITAANGETKSSDKASVEVTGKDLAQVSE